MTNQSIHELYLNVFQLKLQEKYLSKVVPQPTLIVYCLAENEVVNIHPIEELGEA